MTQYKLDIHAVREAARGRWDEIFARLAPQLDAARAAQGRHVPCPVHGGTDGFRLFKDYAQNGACVCNTCGVFRDGFATLAWVNGSSFKEALQSVAATLLMGVDAGARLIERESVGTSWCGPVLYAGDKDIGLTPFTGFVVRLYDEARRRQAVLRGSDLQSAVVVASVRLQVGMRLKVTLHAKETWRDDKGRLFVKPVWSVTALPSLAAQKALAAEKAALNEEAKRTIRLAWLHAKRLDYTQLTALGNPVFRYLSFRGLSGCARHSARLQDLRLADKGTYDGDLRRCCPTMLAAVRDVDGRLMNVHRTLLTDEGRKAPVAVPKRLYRQPEGTSISGCAIRFGKAAPVLALTEGIETGLAVMATTGLPVWACLSAAGLAAVEVPSCVKRVLVFADKDRSGTGERAAQTLKTRLEATGISVEVFNVPYPIGNKPKGIDWADVLVEYGPTAFPKVDTGFSEKKDGAAQCNALPNPRTRNL